MSGGYFGCIGLFACFVAFLFFGQQAFAEPQRMPWNDAVALWLMGNGDDSAGKDSALTLVGDVALGIELSGEDRDASLMRGGDGKAAEFRGGYLSAGQGADAELNLTGQAMSICLRVRLQAGTRDTPLFSKHGGHKELVYNLFCTDLGMGPAFGFELGLDAREAPLRVSVPLDRVGPMEWHDVIVRFTGPKLELFVDGVLVDEEWPMGSLRTGNRVPCMIGAESAGDAVKSGFHGSVDHAALWNRALTDAEITFLSGGEKVVAARDTAILGPPKRSLQYWRPRGCNANLGDCMPFYHDGRFHLFYLFDRRHHASKWGLGAHQWAHVSTTDLATWEEHPMAIPITQQWEGSICTGSVFFHDGVYYAHYAVRMPDGKQHLARATSTDGIHFEKSPVYPLASPPEGYDPMHYRDPFLFEDASGLFHLLVTAQLTDKRDGCLAQLLSKDLQAWTLTEPFIIPGRVTDCPDYFEWNGWYYLFAEYVYWISRGPFGPWTSPSSNRLDVLYVPKTAPFTGGRRIYVSWLPDGGWAGDSVFRELVQHEDGTLGTKFPSEMIPASGSAIEWRLEKSSEGIVVDGKTLQFSGANALQTAQVSAVSRDVRITLEAHPKSATGSFGIILRGTADGSSGCELQFLPEKERVEFHALEGGQNDETTACAIEHVTGLAHPFSLDVVAKGDIIDVCLDNQRTIITRYRGRGENVLFTSQATPVEFKQVEIRPLLDK